ncbi:MAG TPA: YibE/F family protein, partial [Pseudonocardia sp.]|nr:YibE/F family protein [Pseudonocardia sp.]
DRGSRAAGRAGDSGSHRALTETGAHRVARSTGSGSHRAVTGTGRRRASRSTDSGSDTGATEVLRSRAAADTGQTTGAGRAARRRSRPVEPATGHGHGHGHGHAPPSGRRVRMLIAALLVPCALATLVGLVLLWPAGGTPTPPRALSAEPVRATVTQTTASDCSPGSGAGGCVTLLLAMQDGPRPGADLLQVLPVEPGTPRFAVGDAVVLGWSGADPTDPGSYQVVDFQRGTPLIWLAGAFAAAVLLLGRWRGLAALAALALSFAVLLLFVLPAILAGSDPLAVSVVGAGLIMFAVLYLTHGPSARTSVAVLGTLLSLALIAGLGAAFSAATSLTGLDDQTTNLIASLDAGVDARGLLLAGVVIGALGVLDDVTVTQTSAVWELRRANPALGAPALFGSAMRIGRDHVASAVNTLVLAYAGAALPLMLLFSLSGRPLGDVVTSQDVATEVVRTLVGSIGLVASVPITTALAAAVASREKVVPPDPTA